MVRTFLSIGSSITPRESHLENALIHISALGEIAALAPLYESEPYGGVANNLFLNSALLLKTNLGAGELLRALKRIEVWVGRSPGKRLGDREIDIDILLFGNQVSTEPDLVIPHADLANRRFVLQPMADLDPAVIVPREGRTVGDLLRDCPDITPVRLLNRTWGIDGIQSGPPALHRH